MDTDTITHISLCTGYGGIDLALKRVFGERLRTIAYSEIEGFAVANLVSKAQAGFLDDAPVWSDLRSFPWDEFHGLVGILSSGFPCQPFSAAGKRNADSDPRHIFPAILEGISRCRPRLVFLENVEGIISAKLAGDDWRDPAGTPVLLHVLRELERVGYCPTAGLFSASETGAPHQRKRTFLLAYDSSVGIQGCGASWLQEPRPHAGQALPLCGGDAGGEKLADSQRPRLEGQHHRNASAEQAQDVAADAWASGECGAWPSRPGEPQHAWEPPRVAGNAQRKREGHGRNASEFSETQPSVGRDADGPARGVDYAELCVSCDSRVDELRLLGNGVCVPAGERAFRTLIQRFF